jgi:hypothetical protein
MRQCKKYLEDALNGESVNGNNIDAFEKTISKEWLKKITKK